MDDNTTLCAFRSVVCGFLPLILSVGGAGRGVEFDRFLRADNFGTDRNRP